MNPALLALALAAAAGLTILLWPAHRPEPTGPLDPEPLALGLRIPDFQMLDQDAAPRDQSLFDGRVTILDFIFTNCPFICPGLTASMVQIAGELDKTPVRFVSISVDPDHDTPAALRAYLDRSPLTAPRWTLLTGDRPTLDRILTASLGFELQPDPERQVTLPDGSTMNNIRHPAKLLLIGPDRRVLGYYDHNDPQDVARLITRARLAAQQLQR